MHRRHVIKSIIFFVILIPLAILGCNTTKIFNQKIKPEKLQLNKQTVVFPFLAHSGFEPSHTAQATENFIDLLKKSPHILAYHPPKGMALSKGIKSAELGVATCYGLVKKAESLGINALITGVLDHINITTKKTGLRPFRKLSKIYDVSLVINVMDVNSRTLLLSRLESVKVILPLDITKGQKENEIIDQVLQEALPPILNRQASAVISALETGQWTGKILSIDKGSIKINAGKTAGAHPGSRFEVFDREGAINSLDGRSLELTGKKIGAIKVASITETYSLAVPIEEGEFRTGQIIKSVP